jgi:hypothetical protein
MKAFIIFRDRVAYAQRCMAAMFAAGLEPVVVDHGSTYPGAVRWLGHLEKHDVKVLYRGGGHPRGLWLWPPFREVCGPVDRYIVTDPDCVPSEGCPPGWVDHLGLVLDAYPRAKVGLGLRIDNIPLHYPRRDHVLEWEGQFWRSQLAPGVYDAGVDTTLALYQPLSVAGCHSIGGTRTGPPYTADHLAWYEDPAALPEDIRYYHEHAEPGISYWTIGGHSAWGA